MILSHSDVSDSDTHAQDLLQLELDGGLDFVDLGAEILVVGDWGWEFTSWRRTMLASASGTPREWKEVTYPWKDRDPRDEGSA